MSGVHDLRVTGLGCNDDTGDLDIWCATCQAWIDMPTHWVAGGNSWATPEEIQAASAAHQVQVDRAGSA